MQFALFQDQESAFLCQRRGARREFLFHKLERAIQRSAHGIDAALSGMPQLQLVQDGIDLGNAQCLRGICIVPPRGQEFGASVQQIAPRR